MPIPPVYLLELQIKFSKYRIREINKHFSERFSVPTAKIPHITLFGPFILKTGFSEIDLLTQIARQVRKFNSIPLLIDGFDKREGKKGHVIAHKVNPGAELLEMKKSFIAELTRFTKTEGMGDSDIADMWFHSTIAKKLTGQDVQKIWKNLASAGGSDELSSEHDASFFQNILLKMRGLFLHKSSFHQIHPLRINEEIIRISILRRSELLAEYDLAEKKWLSRSSSLSKSIWGHSVRSYRLQNGLELTEAISRPGEIFVIGDTHFGHRNIIDYCARPFITSNVSEMDSVLTNNWNFTVSPQDRVIFLGDVRYGRFSKHPLFYLNRLNGKKHLIRGEHDDPKLVHGMLDTFEMIYQDVKFLFIHDPKDVAPGYDGWVIHGHVHNNNLWKYPFFNPQEKRINVSAEVVNYRPIPLSYIVTLINSGNGRLMIYNLDSSIR
ncbi:MAG TPA: 2'-5' RNA ligase family protein [Methanoregulaceae archaeon]|nr:2'-5' RNA ligase family protein [Methanoregulaceae archaeon]